MGEVPQHPSLLPVLVTPVLVFVIFLLVHWIPFRLRPIQARIQTMTRTLLLCALAFTYPVYRWVSGWEISLPFEAEVGVAAVFAGVLFFLLWCGYVQFYMSFDTSPSLRFLVELIDSGKPSLTADELRTRFDFDDTYKRRIQRAVDGKAILTVQERNETFLRNSKKGEWWAQVGQSLKKFWQLGEGG